MPYISKISDLDTKLKLNQNINSQRIIIENKRTSLAIHYRNSDNPESAKEVIIKTLNSMEETSDLLIKQGKKIVEVRPPVGNNKGKIVEKIVKKNNIKHLIYLGDDTTDVDAFKEIIELRKQENIQAESIVVCSNEATSEYTNLQVTP